MFVQAFNQITSYIIDRISVVNKSWFIAKDIRIAFCFIVFFQKVFNFRFYILHFAHIKILIFLVHILLLTSYGFLKLQHVSVGLLRLNLVHLRRLTLILRKLIIIQFL